MQSDQEDETVMWAIVHGLFLAVGLLMGARNVQALSSYASPLNRWFCFFCGLLSGYALLLGFFSFFAMFGNQYGFVGMLIVFAIQAGCACSVTVTFTLACHSWRKLSLIDAKAPPKSF